MPTDPDDWIAPPPEHPDDDPGTAHERARLRQMAIDACEMCDDEGYVLHRLGRALVCDHIDHTETNRRGMALVREALRGKPNDPSVLSRYRTAPTTVREPDISDPEPEL